MKVICQKDHREFLHKSILYIMLFYVSLKVINHIYTFRIISVNLNLRIYLVRYIIHQFLILYFAAMLSSHLYRFKAYKQFIWFCKQIFFPIHKAISNVTKFPFGPDVVLWKGVPRKDQGHNGTTLNLIFPRQNLLSHRTRNSSYFEYFIASSHFSIYFTYTKVFEMRKELHFAISKTSE